MAWHGGRSLYAPTSSVPMGTLQMWLDVLTPDEAGTFPADDIALPPSSEFEVRVVIWKAKNVVSADCITNMNDLFTRVSGVEGRCGLSLRRPAVD
jgi:hypothetical protein